MRRGGCIAAFYERYTCNASCSLGVCSLQRRVISAYVTSVCAVGERVHVTVCVIALPFRFVSLFNGVFLSPFFFLVSLGTAGSCACALHRALKSWHACAHARAVSLDTVVRKTVRTVTETFFRIYYVEYANLFESSLLLHLSV